MSVEKFHLVNKANRGFEAIADALLDDVYEEDLLVDDEGNVYALVGEIEKGLPSVARQAIREGKSTQTAFANNNPMHWRIAAHQAGQDISRNVSRSGGSVLGSGESIQASQGAKEQYRAASGMRNAVDRGKLGGRLGKQRLAESTAARQAKQNEIAERIRQNRALNGRGVLP